MSFKLRLAAFLDHYDSRPATVRLASEDQPSWSEHCTPLYEKVPVKRVIKCAGCGHKKHAPKKCRATVAVARFGDIDTHRCDCDPLRSR